MKDQKLLDRNKEQLTEALSSLNLFYAGLTLGRSPTIEEAVLYYIENGGAADFAYRQAQASLSHCKSET